MTTIGSALALGDLLWNELPSSTRLGGWAAAFAFRLQQLGVDTALASGVGNDEEGRRAIQELRLLGLECDLIGTENRLRTGSAKVQIEPSGHPIYSTLPTGAADGMATSSALMARATRATLLYFNSLSLRGYITYNCLQAVLDRAPQACKVFDLRFAAEFIPIETVRQGLERADIVRISAEDLGRVHSALHLPELEPLDLCRAIVERHRVSVCIVSDPVYGTTVATRDLGFAVTQPTAVATVDLLGWHEAFLAGFLVKLFQEAPLDLCCKYGERYGAVVAKMHGALQPIAASELTRLQEGNGT